MEYGTCWLVVSLAVGLMMLPAPVTGAKHVDIFQQFQDGSSQTTQQSDETPVSNAGDGNGDAVQTEQPTSSCVEEALPSEPLEVHEKLTNGTDDEPTLEVKNISQPNVKEMFGKITTGFFGGNIFAIGQHVRDWLTAIKNRVQAYMEDMLAKFAYLRHEALDRVRRTVNTTNAKIRDHFRNEFVEYRDVCLPDENQCMQLLQSQLEQYENRLRANVDQCQDKLAEDLAKQRQQVDEARALMNGAFLKMDGCLNRDAGYGRSFLACTGGAVANLAKLTTDSMESFTQRMSSLSGALSRRVDKFDQCVVKRRQLVNQNERQVSQKVKSCFEKQKAQTGGFFR